MQTMRSELKVLNGELYLAPTPTDANLALLGKWLADNLRKPNKQGSDDRPQWSHTIEAAITGYTKPELAPPPPPYTPAGLTWPLT